MPHEEKECAMCRFSDLPLNSTGFCSDCDPLCYHCSCYGLETPATTTAPAVYGMDGTLYREEDRPDTDAAACDQCRAVAMSYQVRGVHIVIGETAAVLVNRPGGLFLVQGDEEVGPFDSEEDARRLCWDANVPDEHRIHRFAQVRP